MAQTLPDWISLSSLFAQANLWGISASDAAYRLLAALRSPRPSDRLRGTIRAYDYVSPPMEEVRRYDAVMEEMSSLADLIEHSAPDFTDQGLAISTRLEELSKIQKPFSGWQERPPLYEPQPVPQWLLDKLETVTSECTSSWADDDEKPHDSTFADWRSGTLEAVYWVIEDEDVEDWLRSERLEFFGLEVSRSLADRVLFYSDEELRQIILDWPRANGDDFWLHIRRDPRIGNRNQKVIRDLWGRYRDRFGKRGAPRKS